MKYKVGDKVLLKDFKEDDMRYWSRPAIDDYHSLRSKIVTIKKLNTIGNYSIKENNWTWRDYEIEGIYIKPVYEPINNRFEILDL